MEIYNEAKIMQLASKVVNEELRENLSLIIANGFSKGLNSTEGINKLGIAVENFVENFNKNISDSKEIYKIEGEAMHIFLMATTKLISGEISQEEFEKVDSETSKILESITEKRKNIYEEDQNRLNHVCEIINEYTDSDGKYYGYTNDDEE